MKELPRCLVNALDSDVLKCVDLGARGGIPSLWRPFHKILSVDAFEPDENACLEAGKNSPEYVHWNPVALSGKSGPRKFYVLNRESGSSFYPPNEQVISALSGPDYWGIKKVMTIDTYSFSDFIRKYDRPLPNMIKLDTQGSELEILSSLEPPDWSDLVALEIEVEFDQVYEGQPLFCELDAFMREKKFRLFDLRTARGYLAANGEANYYLKNYLHFGVGRQDISAKLYAGDALYIRDWEPESFGDSQLWRKLIVSLLIYGYLDYPIHLAILAAKRGIMPKDESEQIVKEIVAGAQKPWFLQRANKLSDLLRRILRRSKFTDDTYQAFWMHRRWPNQ